jgi:ABC-type amino acid transport substrate-binding protein
MTGRLSRILFFRVLPAVLCALTWAVAVPERASAQTVAIAGYEIQGLMSQSSDEIYNVAMRELLDGMGVELAILPLARADALFDAGKVDCTFPNDSAFYEEKRAAGFIQSVPVNHARLYLFARPGEPAPLSLDEARGRTIGAIRGMAYGNAVEEAGLKIELVDEEETNIRKLLAKRVDLILGYVPDTPVALKAHGFPALSYAPDRPIKTIRDSVLCHRTPQAEAFLARFDERLAAMRASGRLLTVLGDRFVPAD